VKSCLNIHELVAVGVLAGHPAPTDDERVEATVRRRSLGTADQEGLCHRRPRRGPAPIAGHRLGELRDRALLMLIGFAGPFRRSELPIAKGSFDRASLSYRVAIGRSGMI
jgi:hypothetical protein